MHQDKILFLLSSIVLHVSEVSVFFFLHHNSRCHDSFPLFIPACMYSFQTLISLILFLFVECLNSYILAFFFLN